MGFLFPKASQASDSIKSPLVYNCPMLMFHVNQFSEK